MCGRFKLTTDQQALKKRFRTVVASTAASPPRFNIAPTQDVVVVGDDGQRHMTQMRWGAEPSIHSPTMLKIALCRCDRCAFW